MFPTNPPAGSNLFANITVQSNQSQMPDESDRFVNRKTEREKIEKNKKHTVMFGTDLRRAFPQPPSNEAGPPQPVQNMFSTNPLNLVASDALQSTSLGTEEINGGLNNRKTENEQESKHSVMFGSHLRRDFPQPSSGEANSLQSTQNTLLGQSITTKAEPATVLNQPANNETQENIKEAENKLEEIQSTSKEHKIPQNTVHSKPGGYSYEMNKLLFMSSFIELLNEHNIVSPEGVFEDTDITQKLFGFFKQYEITLQEKDIPRFQVTKSRK